MIDTVVEAFSTSGDEPMIAADVDRQKQLLGQEDPVPLTPKQWAEKERKKIKENKT